MSRLKKILAEANEINNELALDDIIQQKGEQAVEDAILNLYESTCLETYMWNELFDGLDYKKLKEIDESDVLFLFEDAPEDFLDQIKSSLGYDDSTDFSEDVPDEVVSFFNEKLTDKFGEKFEAFKDEYLKNFDSGSPYDNTHDNTYNNTHNNTVNEPDANSNEDAEENDEDNTGKISNTSELLELNDNIGDKTKLSDIFNIDYPDRDAPFVYIDGEIIEGSSADSHTKIINQWCEENGIDQMKETWYRQSPDKVKKKINKDNVGFGHIDNGMAFIETCMGCTDDEVAQALKDSGYGESKIYKWSKKGQTVTRLAKLNKSNYYLKIYNNIFKKHLQN